MARGLKWLDPSAYHLHGDLPPTHERVPPFQANRATCKPGLEVASKGFRARKRHSGNQPDSMDSVDPWERLRTCLLHTAYKCLSPGLEGSRSSVLRLRATLTLGPPESQKPTQGLAFGPGRRKQKGRRHEPLLHPGSEVLKR